MLCLAILFDGERTGYEIKKESLEGRHRWFVDASYGSIYPALARLAHHELVTVREEIQSGRPSRKVYSITDAGRATFLATLSQSPGPDVYRSRFLLLSTFAPRLPRHVIQAAIEERMQGLRDEIAAIRAAVDEADKDGAPHCDALGWAAAYGENCLSAHLDFLETHGETLIAMSQTDIADAAE
ncbi:PadR family transcriptional regulator [Acuticoccus sediminis]|uniref:PadR family transcriptional regulator n=2 Tax=Acuticoccus sediminis TaxID=2184697 RepID=A0A8B2NX69_9HYPH|nr:PadR family transcriptional regulator [Acuticoccus sediminis]